MAWRLEQRSSASSASSTRRWTANRAGGTSAEADPALGLRLAEPLRRASIGRMQFRLGNSSLLSPYEALRLSLASPRCARNAVHDLLLGNAKIRFPRRIVLHLANRCNFACPMCSIGVAREQRESLFKGDARWDVVEATIREAGRHGAYVELLGGEPTLYRRLGDTISLLTRHQLPSFITTNGFNLKTRAAEMMDAGLKVLFLSVDGWDDASSYQRGLVPGSFSAIREGVAEVERRRRDIFPILRVASVITKANFREFDKIVDAIYALGIRRWSIQHYFFITDGAMAAHRKLKADTGVGDQVMQHHIPGEDSYFDREEVAVLRNVIERLRHKVADYPDLRVDFDWKLDLDAYYSPRRPSTSSTCAMPHNRVDVYTDGRIASCGDGHTLGNVLEGTIESAWNGPARAQLLDVLAREKVMPMCFRCCGIMPGLAFDETSIAYDKQVRLNVLDGRS